MKLIIIEILSATVDDLRILYSFNVWDFKNNLKF